MVHLLYKYSMYIQASGASYTSTSQYKLLALGVIAALISMACVSVFHPALMLIKPQLLDFLVAFVLLQLSIMSIMK